MRRISPRFSSPTQKGVLHSPSIATSSGRLAVTPLIVRSVSALKWVAPMRSMKRPAKPIVGWLSTSKKSALRR